MSGVCVCLIRTSVCNDDEAHEMGYTHSHMDHIITPDMSREWAKRKKWRKIVFEWKAEIGGCKRLRHVKFITCKAETHYHSLVCFSFFFAGCRCRSLGFYDTLDGRISCNTFFEMHSNNFSRTNTEIISFVSPSRALSPPLFHSARI